MKLMEEKTIKKITSSINYKVLGVIGVLTVAYQISLYLVDPEKFNVSSINYKVLGSYWCSNRRISNFALSS